MEFAAALFLLWFAFFRKTVDFVKGFLYNKQAFELCVEKSRSLVERARLEIVYTP